MILPIFINYSYIQLNALKAGIYRFSVPPKTKLWWPCSVKYLDTSYINIYTVLWSSSIRVLAAVGSNLWPF